MKTCSTCCNNACVDALHSVHDRDVCRCHVGDHHRDVHRSDLAGLLISYLLSFMSLERSDSGAYDDANSVRILVLHLNSGLLDGFLSGSDSEMSKRLHTLHRLEVHIVLRIEILDLACELDLGIARIVLGDRTGSRLSLFKTFPESLNVISERCDRTHSGYYDSVCHLLFLP